MGDNQPHFEARDAGSVRIEGHSTVTYPVHIVFVDVDSKDRKRIRFVADFNQNIPNVFALAQLIVAALNEKGFVLP